MPVRSVHLACGALLLLAVPVRADEDHHRARGARESGRALPLARILAQVEAEVPGDVLEVELEEGDEERDVRGLKNRLIYEFMVLTPDGRLVELYYDAATGRRLAEHAGDDDARPRR